MEDRFRFRWYSKVYNKVCEVNSIEPNNEFVNFQLDEYNDITTKICDENGYLIQCTGLKDSLGKLIYEWDILEVTYDGGQIPLFNREYTENPEPERYFVQWSKDWQNYFCRNVDLNHWLNPPFDYINKTFEEQLYPNDADVNSRVTLGKAILVNDYNKFNKIIGNVFDNRELLEGEDADI